MLSTKDLVFKKRPVMLWQPLDQCPIAALQVNLLGGYLVENTSCVIHKRTQQRTTTVFYQLFIWTIHGLCYDYASAVHPTLISIPYSHVHY